MKASTLPPATWLVAILASASGQERSALRAIPLDDSGGFVVTWEERTEEGREPWYAVSLDGDVLDVVEPTSYVLHTRRAQFDPLEFVPGCDTDGLAPGGDVHFVQFVTQPLDEYTEAVRALGATIHHYVPNHAYLVRMTPPVREAVAALPFVRWVGEYHPEFRLEPELLQGLRDGALPERARYVVQVFERGPHQQQVVADHTAHRGGAIDLLHPGSYLLELTMTPRQLASVAGLDEVLWIQRSGSPSSDIDVARQFSGVDHLEAMTGFTGQGVRGEVWDAGVDLGHPDFQHNGGVLIHNAAPQTGTHGTKVTGIVFGDGTVDPMGRGLLPAGKIVFSSWTVPPVTRWLHTAETVDPAGPYRCVFQTNSWGLAPSTSYNSWSSQMDDLVFEHDILITNSMSNNGNQSARPEAWAKNVVAVGGIEHLNTLTRSDDFWSTASIGPASDGRIKPDLAHFYDRVTATAPQATYGSFSGTSAATPITAGCFGLFFQMWHNDVFRNGPTGSTPFFSKPHFTLAKAALINTAGQWEFSGPGHNLHRFHQGWGSASVQRLYDLRDVTFFVDQTDSLGNLATITYAVDVAPGEPDLKATLTWPEPGAAPSASIHRINDLDLRLVAPDGSTHYWGNHGLVDGTTSIPGGGADALNTVENVFVSAPEAGTWTVEVIGADVNTDVDPSTPGTNAVFSLWVTGATGECAPGPVGYCTAGTSASGCRATLSASGTPSASTPTGFVVTASAVEGASSGQFYFGVGGRQASPWGNGTSYRCVAPPTSRGGLRAAGGANGSCDGSIAQDLNARWQSKPSQNPGAGSLVQLQLWYRDPQSTSGQTTSFSDAIEFAVCQ